MKAYRSFDLRESTRGFNGTSNIDVEARRVTELRNVRPRTNYDWVC